MRTVTKPVESASCLRRIKVAGEKLLLKVWLKSLPMVPAGMALIFFGCMVMMFVLGLADHAGRHVEVLIAITQ